MTKRKSKPRIKLYQEGDTPNLTPSKRKTVCHAVYVLPSAGMPDNCVHIDCEPKDWPKRRRAIVRRHPDWFMARQPVVFNGKRQPL